MGQIDTWVHQLRDENSIPYKAEAGNIQVQSMFLREILSRSADPIGDPSNKLRTNYL